MSDVHHFESARAGASAQPPQPEALFQPFSWHDVKRGAASPLPSSSVADFAGTVLDVTAGVNVILQMIERDEIDEACTDESDAPLPRLMAPIYAGHLTRLSVAALALLAARSEEIIAVCNEAANAQAGSAT